MGGSSQRKRSSAPGQPDRREIAQDLFREHLDLDRITRVTKALHADGKPERRQQPSFLLDRDDTDIHPPCGSSMATSVADTLPPAERGAADNRPGSHAVSWSGRGVYLRVAAVLALVMPAVVIPAVVHDGQRSVFPVAADIARVDTAAPPRPSMPTAWPIRGLEPGGLQTWTMWDRPTRSYGPVTPVQYLETQPDLMASVAVRTSLPNGPPLQLASFTPTYEPVPNGGRADLVPAVHLRSPATGVLKSKPVLPGVPNRLQHQAAVIDTPDNFHDGIRFRQMLPVRAASVPALPLIDDTNSSPSPVRTASLFEVARPSLTGFIKPATDVDTGFPEIGEPVGLTRPRARPDPVTLSPAPATAVGSGPARIVIHYNSVNSGRLRADGLAQQLSATGIGSVELRSVGFEISRDNIRFFFPADSSVARRVGGVMTNSGATIRDFSTFRPSPRRGTIEIWLAS